MSRSTILLADDENTLRENLAQVLKEEGFNVVACCDGTEAHAALKRERIDLMITDLRMPGMSGMELIDVAKKLAPDAGIVVITAFGEVETAVEAMKKGAQDYICKPFNFDEVIIRIKRLIDRDGLARENKVLREQIRRTHATSTIVGESPKFVALLKTIERVAQTASNVLISGESGTGKEVLARAIHYGGPRKDRPFVAVNCGGLAESLVESELFGYRRGAFTGANADRTGYFEAADGGTLFLDEISTLPYKSQATMLRAIEERAVTRVGDNRARPVNIHIIAATNRDLEEAIEREEFRQDLYFRLNVIGITVPPLRERREDIPLLIDHFVERYNAELNCHCPGFTPRAVEAMIQQRWRGNVRELENVVERALIFSDDRAVDVQDLGGTIDIPDTIPAPSATVLRTALRDFERQHIESILAHNGNSKAAAAEKLGIGLSSLYRKLEELGIGKTNAEKEHTA